MFDSIVLFPLTSDEPIGKKDKKGMGWQRTIF
jgi:hypothetical protein